MEMLFAVEVWLEVSFSGGFLQETGVGVAGGLVLTFLKKAHFIL